MLEAPLLLVLDEPTSGLDTEAEHALFDHYASAASRAPRAVGAVTVLVSHRFFTVRLADLIVVVDGGRICEQGSHEQVMAAKGLYAELYGLQAQAYRLYPRGGWGFPCPLIRARRAKLGSSRDGR